jgi:hypothetical protein
MEYQGEKENTLLKKILLKRRKETSCSTRLEERAKCTKRQKGSERRGCKRLLGQEIEALLRNGLCGSSKCQPYGGETW